MTTPLATATRGHPSAPAAAQLMRRVMVNHADVGELKEWGAVEA